jgi:hypothetical protein
LTPESKYGKEPFSMIIGHPYTVTRFDQESPMYDGSNPNWIGPKISRSSRNDYYKKMKASYELPIFFESIYEDNRNKTLYSRPYPFWNVRECSVA